MSRVTAPIEDTDHTDVSLLPFGDVVMVGLPAGILRELMQEAARLGVPLAVVFAQAVGEFLTKLRNDSNGG